MADAKTCVVDIISLGGRSSGLSGKNARDLLGTCFDSSDIFGSAVVSSELWPYVGCGCGVALAKDLGRAGACASNDGQEPDC